MRNFEVKKIGYYGLISIIFILAIFIRTKLLLINPSFWHDETALAWNLKFKNYEDFFGLLRFAQMAPPFFMVVSKFFTSIVGFSDLSIRIIPYIAGILSIFAFYFLSKEVFQSKLSIILANFLFAVNKSIINYATEFKHYGVDVLFTILSLLFFMKLRLEKITLKNASLYGMLLGVSIWFSFVSAFAIAAGLLITFLTDFKSNLKKKIAMTLPLAISSAIYYFVYISNNYQSNKLVQYWQDSFIKSDLSNFMPLVSKFLAFTFAPATYILIIFALIIWGGIKMFFHNKKFFFLSILSIIFLIISSMLKVYPIEGRIILFITPILMLLLIEPIEGINKSKKVISGITVLLALSWIFPNIKETCHYINLKTFSRGSYTRQMMIDMNKKIKKDDIIFINNLSNTDFYYYASYNNLKNTVIQERLKNFVPNDEYIKYLNTLEHNKNYWFFLSFSPRPAAIKWIKDNTKIISVNTYGNKKAMSYLIYAYRK